MNTFKIIKNKDNDEFFYCTTCSGIMVESEKESHTCPKSQIENDMMALQEIIDNEENTIEQRISAIKDMVSLSDDEWQKELTLIESKCSGNILQKLVKDVIIDVIERVKKMRDNEYIKNDELRIKGVPLQERMRQIDRDKIDLYEKYISRLTNDLKHYKVKPIREWLTRSDWQWAKRIGKGMKFIIMINLGQVYSVPKKN